MASKQLTVNFPVRKTRSSVRLSQKLETLNTKINGVSDRRPLRRRTAASPPPADPTNPPCSPCSPSKRQKDNISEKLLSSPDLSKVDQNVNFTTPKKQSCGNKENCNTPSPNIKTSPLKLEGTSMRDTAKKFTPISLFRQDVSVYQELKKVLSSSETTNLYCREAEVKVISSFLTSHLNLKKSGSLYVSGAPGTGKTASLNQIIQAVRLNENVNFKYLYINCTNLTSSSLIFERIYSQLDPKAQLSNSVKSSDIQALIQNKIVNSKNTILLVLDEVDFLESHSQNVLYAIFEWPSLVNSRLLLIGIANALDLIDRVLPRLQVISECKPTLLHFKSYTKDQIVTILQGRLSQVSSDASEIIKPAALQFCARKVASTSGDIRKALDLCRRAVEKVEMCVRKQQILKPRTSSDDSSTQSTSKESPGKLKSIKYVELPTIVSILDDVYGEKLTKGVEHNENSLPIQQKVLLCSLILIFKNKKCQEVILGKFHEVYSRVCETHKVVQQVDLSEFLNLCNLLDVRGLITIKKNKDIRLAKVNLKMPISEAEFVLEDKSLLASILADSSCLSAK